MAKETSIWNLPDDRPERIIYVPTKAERAFDEALLDRQNNVTSLQEEAYRLRDTLKKYKLVAIDENGVKSIPEPIQLMYCNEKKKKQDYITFITILNHPDNFHLFYEGWSDPVKNLFKKAIQEHYVFHKDATKILGEPSTKNNSKYYWDDDEPNDKIATWFEVTNAKAPVNTYDQRSYYLELKRNSMYTDMLPIIFKGIDQVDKCLELPHAEAYKTYSGENDIFTIFPIMSSLFDSAQLNLGRNKLPANEVKKAAKLLNIPEFFNDDNKYFSNICASMVLNIYTVYCEDWYNNKLKETHELIKDMMNYLGDFKEYLLPVLMPHITGLRKTVIEDCTCGSIANKIYITLKNFHSYGWLPIEKINYVCRTGFDYSERSFQMFNIYDMDKVSLHNDYDGKDIYLHNLLQEITRPYIKAVLFMLSAFGLVEIAYREKPAEGATSYYDSLEYVRLTNLGLYALGVKQKYTRTKQADIKYFELDTERLIVKSLVDNNPYESLLGNMATAISKKMYKVSYESFLNGCAKLQDITNKIDFFKEYICDDLPANWSQFFENLKKRCKPMKAPQKKYSLLQLPSDDKELQRIVLNDPTVRKYTLKAEGFILLVETNNKSKVVDALKKYGYLL